MEDPATRVSPLERVGRHVLSLRTVGFVSVMIIGAAVFYRSHLLVNTVDCFTLMAAGQWVSNRWYPYQCVLNRYPNKRLLPDCSSELSPLTRNLLFIGDTDLLEYFKVIALLTNTDQDISLPDEIDKNFPLSFTSIDKTYNLEYVWKEEFNSIILEQYQNILKTPFSSLPNVIVHKHLKYMTKQSAQNIKERCSSLVKQLMSIQTAYITKFNSNTTRLRPTIIFIMRNDVLGNEDSCQKIVQNLYSEASSVIKDHVILLNVDSAQFNNPSSLQGLEVILHFVCNSKTYGNCCLSSDKSLYQSIILPILVIILSVYIALVFLRATGTLIPLEPYFEAASIDLNQVYTVIHLTGVITLTIFYSCITDRLEFFFSASPWRSSLLCTLLLIAIICLGFMMRDKINQSQPSELLCKEQVTEWRGWSVLVLLALEYTDMAETNIGSWLWLLMISCVACSSAYTHFNWFWDNGDFSWKRVVKVLFCQNYLTIWFCLVLRSSYGLYLVPVVMTIVFVIVYITMATIYKLSSAGNIKNNSKVYIAFKLSCVGFILIILTVIELSLDWQPLSVYFLGLDSNFRNGQLWTMPYIIRIMSILGVSIGYFVKTNQPSISMSLSFGLLKLLFVVIILASYGLFIMLANVTFLLQGLHSILSPLVIVAYLIIRNWNNHMRVNYSVIFKCFGSMSIEFYVLFQHLMLSNNTRGLLYLFPSYYSINMLATLIILLFLSVVISQLANEVTNRTTQVLNIEEEKA